MNGSPTPSTITRTAVVALVLAWVVRAATGTTADPPDAQHVDAAWACHRRVRALQGELVQLSRTADAAVRNRTWWSVSVSPDEVDDAAPTMLALREQAQQCAAATPVVAGAGVEGPRYQAELAERARLSPHADSRVRCHDVAESLRRLSERVRAADEWRATRGIGAYNHAALVWELYEPVAACCDRDRIGAAGDGGKYACLPDETFLGTAGGIEGRRCVVYSFGSADDASFESEIVRRFGCEVHTFDPTPGLPPLEAFSAWGPLSCFHPIGLGPAPSSGHQLAVQGAADGTRRLVLGGVSVPSLDLMQIAGSLRHERVDLLKIDIEGSEWTAVPFFLEQPGFAQLRVAQILVELHFGVFGADQRVVDRLFTTMRSAGYYPFSKEANLRCGAPCIEYSFIHFSRL